MQNGLSVADEQKRVVCRGADLSERPEARPSRFFLDVEAVPAVAVDVVEARQRLWPRTTQLELLHGLADVRGDDQAACHWATLGIEASEQYLRLCADSKR